MSDYKQGETGAVVLAGMCTALAVVLSMIGLYVPLFSSIVFLLIPLPIAYLGMKQGVRWSIIVTAGILILDSVFFGVISAAFLCAIFGVLGVVMGLCYEQKLPASYTLILGAIVVLASLIGEGFATLYLLDMQPLIFGGQALDSMKAAMLEPLPQFYSGDALKEAQDNVELMVESMAKGLPFSVVGAAFFYSWASMTLGKMIFGRMGIKDIPVLPPLERWEMPKWSIALYAVGAALPFLWQDNETAGMVGYNLGLAGMMLFWLQGLAVLWWMPHRYRWMRSLRWLIALFSLFNAFLQMVMIFLGLFDMAIGYRKKRNYGDDFRKPLP